MKFSDFIIGIKSKQIEGGTEPVSLKPTVSKIIQRIEILAKTAKVQKNKIPIRKIADDITAELISIGNTLTTEFETETLRNLGDELYNLADELKGIKDTEKLAEKLQDTSTALQELVNPLKQTGFFDYSKGGISKFLDKRLSSIKNFERIVSVKTDEYNSSDSKEFKFIAQFDDKLDFDKKVVERAVKRALKEFEFVYLDKDANVKLNGDKPQAAFVVQFENSIKIQEAFLGI